MLETPVAAWSFRLNQNYMYRNMHFLTFYSFVCVCLCKLSKTRCTHTQAEKQAHQNPVKQLDLEQRCVENGHYKLLRFPVNTARSEQELNKMTS